MIEGGGLGGDLMQHGPVQVLSFCRSLDDFNPEHLTWSHLKQLEHCIAVGDSGLTHSEQYQIGPGFCSIPARMRRSRIR